MPPAISATPLATTTSFFHRAIRGGTIASYCRGMTKCIAPANDPEDGGAGSRRH